MDKGTMANPNYPGDEIPVPQIVDMSGENLIPSGSQRLKGYVYRVEVGPDWLCWGVSIEHAKEVCEQVTTGQIRIKPGPMTSNANI